MLVTRSSLRLFVLISVLLITGAACTQEQPTPTATARSASPTATTAPASTKTLYIAGIPDADVSLLQARFNGMAGYLTKETGIRTQYVPSTDYAGVVTAFKQGNLHLAWYGGLTGVQARLAVPGAQAIAQRPIDEQFHSVFIAQKGLGITKIGDFKGKTFTFGSESSTSGYVMPLYFLKQDGLDPKKDFASMSFSGSHDKTWKLVETGAFQGGVLNASIWETRVKNNEVDLTKVEVVWTTPAYYDYHWVIRPDVDQTFGPGTAEKLKAALLKINADHSPEEKAVMDTFQSKSFIPTKNENYTALENVARSLGVIE